MPKKKKTKTGTKNVPAQTTTGAKPIVSLIADQILVKGVPVQLGLKLDLPAKTTSVDLQLVGRLSYEEGRQTLLKVKQLRGATQWWIAAMIVQGMDRWGEEWPQAVSDANIEPETVKRYISVYTKIPVEMRIPSLDFSHHKEIAALDTLELRAEWLLKCAENNWTVAELIQELVDAGLRRPRAVTVEPEYSTEPAGDNGSSGPQLCACCGEEEGTIKIGGHCFAQLAPEGKETRLASTEGPHDEYEPE